MKLKNLTLSLLLAAFPFVVSAQIIAFDTASNYSSWTDGSNEGTGFGAWSLTSGTGGHFIGSSGQGGVRSPNIDSAGNAFGMWHDDGSATEVVRGFAPSVWGNNRALTFDLSFRFTSGTRGVTLLDSSDIEIFFFTFTGGGFDWSGGGNAPMTDWTDERENGEILSFSFTQSGSDVLFAVSGQWDSSPNATGSVAGTLDRFRIFSFAEAGGPDEDTFVNNFTVIPEPGTYAALIGLAGLALALLRRRRG